jgi:hypothetical protein
MDFFKNPIFIAIIAAGLTYLYMWWDNKKKQEDNPKAAIEELDITPPILVGLVALFIAYNLFGFGGNTSDNTIEQVKNLEGGNGVKLIEGKPLMHTKFSDKLADSFDSNTYHLIGKNMIKLPQTDVFIDIAKF